MFVLSRRGVIAAAGATATASVLPWSRSQAASVVAEPYTAPADFANVDSTLVMGDQDAILIDAQFSLPDAQAIADMVRASGRRLTTVYITHEHPDHHLGAEIFAKQFPDAAIVAHPAVVERIAATADAKAAGARQRYGDKITSSPVIPAPLTADHLMVEDVKLEILGPFQGDSETNTSVWVPDLKTLIAADVVYSGTHVWLADAGPERYDAWRGTLDQLAALEPEVVIPGHLGPNGVLTVDSLDQTRTYLNDFEAALAKASNSEELMAAMMASHGDLALPFILGIAAKVRTGEMTW